MIKLTGNGMIILATESNGLEKFVISEWFLQKAPQTLLDLLVRVVLCIVFFLIGTRIISLIRKIVARMLNKSNASKDVSQFLDSALKVGMYIFLVVQLAVGLGLDATTIATVFGSATVTIGLAFQGSLKNCIGGILILILKPFHVGDYIIESNFNHEGTVKEITIFYTRLATLDNKTILLPNGSLADTSIVNVTSAEKRRLEIKVGISYDSDIRKAKAILEDMIVKEERVCLEDDYAVYVDSLADSSVILGMRCWTKSSDFWAVRCYFMEEIKYAFDDNGINIPYPQMDVHVKNTELK